jgi:hypothetical protein
MVSRAFVGILIASVAGCHPAFAKLPCDYDKTVETNWVQQIEKTSNIDKKVFPYVDDTRKCIMKMDVTIDGETYPTNGEYVFGPDMTENAACEEATLKAKKKIITQVSPEILTAKTEMNCSTNPQETVQVVESLPQETVIEGEVIVETKTIDTAPTLMVEYNQTSIIDDIFTIRNKLVGLVDTPRNKPFLDPRQPRCVADWKNGGRWCHNYD